MNDQDALAESLLSQVVDVGTHPTRQQQELGDAVLAHVAERPARSRPEPDPDVLSLLDVSATLVRTRACIRHALNELGVPGPDYPAPVANAVAILEAALVEEP